MAVTRATPDEYFKVDTQEAVQEVIPVIKLQTVEPAQTISQTAIDPNIALIALGIVAIVGIVGLFAYLAKR